MLYFDNAATTQIDPRVFDKMKPFLTDSYGNAGSLHRLGREAAKAVEEAREQIAALIGAMPEQIVFTSGGSEANSLALLGVRHILKESARSKGVMISATEHESVMSAANKLCGEVDGYDLCTIMPNRSGAIPAANITQVLDTRIGIVSIMYVNNETGAINPVEDIATLCLKAGVPFHTDCVQALGTVPIDVQTIGCDMLSVSSHKIHGPKGVGALFVKDKDMLEPLICGSESQEYGLRGGTENVASIVGFGEACRLLRENFKPYSNHMAEIKQECYAELKRQMGDEFRLNGPSVMASGKILSLTFPNVDAQTLLLMLDTKGICVSAGSACSAHSMKPSHVLKAMGMTDDEANSTIRVSFSRFNELQDAVTAAKMVAECVCVLRKAV